MDSYHQNFNNNDEGGFHQDLLDKDGNGALDEGRRVLLAITVEIEEGRMEMISVREGDYAEEVAATFCRQHAIPDHYVSPLTEHILTKLQEISGTSVDGSSTGFENKDSSRSGMDSARSGRDSARSGRDSARSGGDSARSGRDSARSGRSSARSGRSSARSGRLSARTVSAKNSARSNKGSGRDSSRDSARDYCRDSARDSGRDTPRDTARDSTVDTANSEKNLDIDHSVEDLEDIDDNENDLPITNICHKQSRSPHDRLSKPKLCTHKLCSLKNVMDHEQSKVKARGKPTSHNGMSSFSSLAKSQRMDRIERIEQSTDRRSDLTRSADLSPKSKAVYTRLYVEFLRHKQRMEEEKKECLEQYQERLERDKPTYTKKTRRIMMLRGRAAKQFKNYGELLYQEALCKDKERKRLAEQKLKEEESQEMNGITAKPEISKYAKQLKRPEKFWERLSTDNSKSHLRELQHESLEMKLMECTFKPRINRNFQGENDGSTSSRFDQLFWDAENRRRRQAEYMQWYPEGVTFRPMINPQWAPSSMYGHDGHQKGNVFNRLLQYAQRLAEKKQKWQDNENKLVDPTTGQELFKPQTGRKPHGERKTDAMPIGDFLYQLKFSLDNKKRTLQDRNIQKAKEMANCQYVSSRSSKLLESIRMRSIQEIFDVLDTDKDGYIDLCKADMKDLPNEVVEDLNEIRDLGPEYENHLSFEQFASVMMSIQKKKKRPGTRLLLKPCRKHVEQEKYPFKFKVDRRSCQLAPGRRKPGNTRHWYRLVLSDREKKQAKIEALRKEKENQELAECTFRPALHKKDNKGPVRFIHRGQANNQLSPQSTVVEKEQQEIHGFIFQEVMDGPATNTETEAVGADSNSPLSLLKSLKRMVSRDGTATNDKPAPQSSRD